MFYPFDVLIPLYNMKSNQWKSQQEIESIQEEKLKKLISYASQHVPYYKKSMKGHSINDLSNLSELPMINKRSAPDNI